MLSKLIAYSLIIILTQCLLAPCMFVLCIVIMAIYWMNRFFPPTIILMMKCFEAYSPLIVFLCVLALLVMAISDLFKNKPQHCRHQDDDLLRCTVLDNIKNWRNTTNVCIKVYSIEDVPVAFCHITWMRRRWSNWAKWQTSYGQMHLCKKIGLLVQPIALLIVHLRRTACPAHLPQTPQRTRGHMMEPAKAAIQQYSHFAGPQCFI